MIWVTLRRLMVFGWKDFWRNSWLSIATVLTLVVTLFTISVFGMQSYIISQEAANLRQKLDMSVYLTDAPSEDDITADVTQIKKLPDVATVQYLNKQQVLDEWNKLQANSKIKDLVSPENNPLPRTIKIKADDPAKLGNIADAIQKSSFGSTVLKISYQDTNSVITQLNDQAQKTSRNGIILGIIFLLVSMLVVLNTIRLVIHFRDEEIGIMKLVGASRAFVRGPFYVESLLYGLFSGLLTSPIIYFYLRNGLTETTSLVANTTDYVTSDLFNYYQAHWPLITLFLIVASSLIALLCTAISLRRYLRT